MKHCYRIGIAVLVAAMMVVLAVPALAAGIEKKDLHNQPGTSPSVGLLDCTGAAELFCGGTALAGDNTGHANNVVNYGCSGLNENGGEDVYYFTLASESQVTITLTPDAADLDLWLLGSCDEAACLTYSAGVSTETITECLPAGTYYVVVDGYGSTYPGAEGSYTIALECASCPSAPDPVQGGETCADAVSLGDWLHGNAFNIAYDCTGFTNDYDEDYNCGQYGSSGEDMVYSVCLQPGGTIDITQTGDTDMVLWMVEDCGNLTTCVASSDNCCTGADEHFTYTSVAGGTYFIIVDGYTLGPVGTISGTIDGFCTTPTGTESWGGVKELFR